MTDIVSISVGHVSMPRENARTFQHGGHSLGWVVPDDETILADIRGELSSGPYGAFNQTSDGTSLDVELTNGEAFVAGTPLARDEPTTITLGENVSDVTIYVGWAVQAKDTVVIGEADDFTSDDPRLPLWTFSTDADGITEAIDERDLGALIDVENKRYEGGSGKVDEARSADKIAGVGIDNLVRGDEDTRIDGRVEFTRHRSTHGVLGQGDGETLRFGAPTSDSVLSFQGGHGRVMWSWNAYWDNEEGGGNGQWRSIVGDEYHACIGMVNNHPGYDTHPSSIVFGTASPNDESGDVIEWNWIGMNQFGSLEMGGNQIQNFSLERRDDRPSNPSVGRIIYRTDQDSNLTY